MPGARQIDLEQLIAEGLEETIEECQEQEDYLLLRATETGLAIYGIRAAEARSMRIEAERQLEQTRNC